MLPEVPVHFPILCMNLMAPPKENCYDYFYASNAAVRIRVGLGFVLVLRLGLYNWLFYLATDVQHVIFSIHGMNPTQFNTISKDSLSLPHVLIHKCHDSDTLCTTFPHYALSRAAFLQSSPSTCAFLFDHPLPLKSSRSPSLLRYECNVSSHRQYESRTTFLEFIHFTLRFNIFTSNFLVYHN